jgi:hypothetical protein
LLGKELIKEGGKKCSKNWDLIDRGGKSNHPKRSCSEEEEEIN